MVSATAPEWSSRAPGVLFTGVALSYGADPVLTGVDLELRPGESLALVGRNGAGKSSLIKGMLDLTAVDAGSITIDGVASGDRHARGRLAYLPERFQPPWYLRGREFIDCMLALYRVLPDAAETERTCARLGLAAADLDRPARTYSKGMAQMLGLAACLLSGRDLLVLDEPMSGLDPTARVRVQQTLLDRHAAGASVFFTTHLLADAERMADRVAILHGGRIAALGTPVELCDRFHADDLEQAFAACVGTLAV